MWCINQQMKYWSSEAVQLFAFCKQLIVQNMAIWNNVVLLRNRTITEFVVYQTSVILPWEFTSSWRNVKRDIADEPYAINTAAAAQGLIVACLDNLNCILQINRMVKIVYLQFIVLKKNNKINNNLAKVDKLTDHHDKQ